MKANDLKDKPPKILIYGRAGCGKTALASQASGGYMIDADQGMLTARNLEDEFTKYRHFIEFDEIIDDPRNPKGWIKFKEQIFTISRLIRAKQWPYDALVIDSLTRLGTMCINQVMAGAGKPGEPPQLQHYNTIVSEIRNMLQLITTFPVLVIVCTHEVPIESDDGTMIKPKSVGQKLPDEVVPMFDEVWTAKVKKLPAGSGHADYLISWLPSNVRESRTRSGTLQELKVKELGLRGILKAVGYDYKHEPTKEVIK
jgi:hypothetical protein